MKRITYSLYNRNGEKTKTVEVYEKDPVFLALETYINGEQTPQYISELNIVIEKIEESKNVKTI
jgi:hypothetical protein